MYWPSHSVHWFHDFVLFPRILTLSFSTAKNYSFILNSRWKFLRLSYVPANWRPNLSVISIVSGIQKVALELSLNSQHFHNFLFGSGWVSSQNHLFLFGSIQCSALTYCSRVIFELFLIRFLEFSFTIITLLFWLLIFNSTKPQLSFSFMKFCCCIIQNIESLFFLVEVYWLFTYASQVLSSNSQ